MHSSLKNKSAVRSSDSSNSEKDSRLVADILASMAGGEIPVTPTTYALLEGFTSGVPTLTTPTITPTTMRNIEHLFMEANGSGIPQQVEHQHQAGFVPPLVTLASSQSFSGGCVTSKDSQPVVNNVWMNAPILTNTRSASASSSSSTSSMESYKSTVAKKASTRGGGGRNGGRRPKNDTKLSPEEEERRRVRRERNKQAAARCRKRRLDHTLLLEGETDSLEDKKRKLENEITKLEEAKMQLECLLTSHQVDCKIPRSQHNKENQHQVKVKSEYVDFSEYPPVTSYADVKTASHFGGHVQPTRPNSLSISSNFAVPTSTCRKMATTYGVTEATGIPITTPSAGMFNFDSMMDGSTGLTPIVGQQRVGQDVFMVSPGDLHTPKLCSL